MSRTLRINRRQAAIAEFLSPLLLLAGCPTAAVVGFTIAAGTFIFVLGDTGILEARGGATQVTQKGGVVTLPFDSVPEDHPTSGTLNLNVGTTQALPLAGSAKALAQQSLTGVAHVTVFMASATSTNPCSDGVRVGTYDISFDGGRVSVANSSLPLPSQALEHAIAGTFTICLQMNATVDVRLVIGEMSVTFGPATGETPIEPSGDDNPNDDEPDDGGVVPTPTPTPAPTPVPTPGPAIPDGFTLANILAVGSERIIAGASADATAALVTPANFSLGGLALSGDGQKVWFYLYWDSVQQAPADWLRVYCCSTDGTGLQRSDLGAIESSRWGLGPIAVSQDGQVAIFEMESNRGPSPFAARPGSRFVRLSPGQPAASVLDVDPVVYGAATPSVSAGRGLRLNDDGTQFFWCDGDELWCCGAGSGTPERLVTVAHLNFYGPWAPFTGGSIITFDIDASGANWLCYVRFTDPATQELRHELIRAAGALPQNLTGIPKAGNRFLYNPIFLTDDGSTAGYGETSNGDGDAYVQAIGGTPLQSLKTSGIPALYGVFNPVLSENGQVACGFHPIPAGSPAAFFQDVASATRRQLGSTRFLRDSGGLYGLQLSHDGRTVVGLWNARAIGTPINNIYVLRDGLAGLDGYPRIENLYYRYDASSDTLVVRAIVVSATGLERIYVNPLKNGIDPYVTLPTDQNPLFDERGGLGVNFGTVFTPVPGAPNTYERAIQLRGKKALLDASYSLRIIAVDATGRRTTYADMAIWP